MKAFVYKSYGRPDVLSVGDVPVPKPAEDEVLVRIKAVSLNASDWEFLTGSPIYARFWGLFKPSVNIIGSDIAGIVEAVGKDVTRFKAGDAVLGDVMYTWGGLATCASVPEDKLILKPDHISFEEAAAIPQAGVVALQGLRDRGRLKAGEHVLINGAGGGAGTFAIQLAKLMGATVTAVDADSKFGLMRSLGADHVLDYRTEDFTAHGEQYDVILDLVACRSVFDHKRALNKGGRYVVVGGAVARILQTLVCGPFIRRFSGKDMGILAHEQKLEDMEYLLSLYQEGKVKPAIDKCFPFEETVAAFCHLGAGHAKGKLVIEMSDNAEAA